MVILNTTIINDPEASRWSFRL